MDRIYGKPEQPLAVMRPEPTALQAFARSLSLDEKLALLRRLRAGELGPAEPTLPTIEVAAPD
jgi:hypothetical protein